MRKFVYLSFELDSAGFWRGGKSESKELVRRLAKGLEEKVILHKGEETSVRAWHLGSLNWKTR